MVKVGGVGAVVVVVGGTVDLVVGGWVTATGARVVAGAADLTMTTVVEVTVVGGKRTRVVDVVEGGGGLVTTCASSDPHPDPKAATRTTGTAKPTRRRNVLWRAPGRGGALSGSCEAVSFISRSSVPEPGYRDTVSYRRLDRPGAGVPVFPAGE